MSYTDFRTSNKWRMIDLSEVADFEYAEDGTLYPQDTIYVPYLDSENERNNKVMLSRYDHRPGEGYIVITPRKKADAVYLHAILEDKWESLCYDWFRDWRVGDAGIDTFLKLFTVKIPYHMSKETRKRITEQLEDAENIRRKALSMLETADSAKRHTLMNMFRE